MFPQLSRMAAGLRCARAAARISCTAGPAAAAAVPRRTMAWRPPGASSVPDEDAEIRAMIAQLCGQYPGEYWRELDASSTYPHAFVDALQDAGILSMLIPEEYGGTGSKLREATAALEEIHANGCNGAAAHAQMYVMGSVLRHGNEEQKSKWLPQIADGLRLQVTGTPLPPLPPALPHCPARHHHL